MIFALVIIAAEHLASARALAESAFGLSAEAAALEFVPAGSPTGALPASHYWLSGAFSAEQYVQLQQLNDLLPWAELHTYDPATEPGTPASVLAALNLQPIPTGGPV